MRKIHLIRDKFVLVDDVDYVRLSAFKWILSTSGYAVRSIATPGKYANGKGRRKLVYMHRELMGAVSGQMIDHINRDQLDNRRKNLRFCSSSENHVNSKVYKNNSTGYRGVYRQYKKWTARLNFRKNKFLLGTFDTKKEAVEARRSAEEKILGEFAPV